MKRLYEVNGEYFADKKAAKAARGAPTKEAVPAESNVFGSKNAPPQYKFEIHRGPDHWQRGGAIPGSKPKPVKRVRRKLADTAEVGNPGVSI